MAITRAQIPEQIDVFREGGSANSAMTLEELLEAAKTLPRDEFDAISKQYIDANYPIPTPRTAEPNEVAPVKSDPYTDLYNEMSSLQPTYDTSYQKYMQRLSQNAPQRPKMNIFDVASELGRGLLSTPNTGVGSAYQGLGVGFDNISQKIQADKKMYEDQRREIQMMATQLAMQDEQKAEEFLNQVALKRIEAANKDVDYITLEYDEVIGGETVTKRQRIPDTQANAAIINDLYEKNNAREIKPATTQINLPGGSTDADKAALNQMFKDQEAFGEKAEASNSTLDQVSQARLLAEEVGSEDFGPFSRATLQAREFVDGIGFGDLLEDPSKIAPQKALNQLSMSFTMGIVSQTKGAISDREMKLFIQASPTLGSTYEGYMKQLELLERLAARDSQFYQEYIDKSMELDESGISLRKQQLELEKFASTWKRNNPLFTREETEMLQTVVNSGEGLAEDFDRNAFEKSINDRKTAQGKKIARGVEGVPDGSTLISEIGGVKYYLKPGGDVNNKDDIIKVE
tara:strand:+ start:3135 stop:4682 length:1548 start_codon:yes stop_codon:yes gene_type:complete